MTDLEQQLTDHLRRRAAAATPRYDLEGIERKSGDAVLDLTTAGHRTRTSLWLAVAAAIVLLAVVGALMLLDDDESGLDTAPATEPTTTTAPPTWTGPDLDRGTIVHPMVDRALEGSDIHEFTWQDPTDVAVASIDVLDVFSVEFPSVVNDDWSLNLVAVPPRPADLEPGMVVTFGIAFDTNADGIADYTAGIDGDAAMPDGFRAWLTDLATNETKEQEEGSYGYPFNYALDSGIDLMALGDAAPPELNLETARFYVWTAVIRDGVLVANDYVPDTGWLSRG